jgi:hypothetical protein
VGLPARQRKVLVRIESALRGSDPKLAALYAIFARLNRDEEMPRIEQLRHSALVALARLRRAPVALAARLRIRRIPRPRAVLLLPLALLLAAGSIVYAVTTGSKNDCAPVRQVASARVTGKSRLCRPVPAVMSPGFYPGR